MNIEQLNWNEAIRKRPGMYLGHVNHKGLVDTLKRLISDFLNLSNSEIVNLEFRNQLEGQIEFRNIQKPVRKDISILNRDNLHNQLDIPVLNALSSNMEIIFDSTTNSFSQEFVKGEHKEQIENTEVSCKNLIIKYSLDKEIWGNDFSWNSNYLSYVLREFFYLNSDTKFQITELRDGITNTNSYHYKNGLSDRLEIEILNAIGVCYFKHHLKFNTDQFEYDVAYAFRKYSVDQTFIKTYVNNEITPENGSHLDGLLKGLTYGVMKYFQANDLVNEYKISEKGVKEGLVCMINLKMDSAIYSGCVKNKLANSEIIEPIAKHISEIFFESILRDEESTKLLIDKFKI